MATIEQIDAFWHATLEQAARVPLHAAIEEVKEPVPYLHSRVSYASLGGARIVAHLSCPITQRGPARLPAIVTAPGYGGWEFGHTLSECQRGYVVLQVYPRMQGESGTAPEGPGHLLRGIGSPEGYYYQGAYVDILRAIEYLARRADVDPNRIGAMGTSQGASLVLAAAALDPRVKAVVAHVPYFCDMRNNDAFRGTEMHEPAHLETFDYFDPVNLACRIAVPVLLSSGGKDATCPAATIHAVFGRLRGIKALFHDPELTHTSSIGFYRMGWEWLERHLQGAMQR